MSSSKEVILAYLRGVEQIEGGAKEPPQYFTERALQQTRKIVSVLNNGIKRVAFFGPNSIEIAPTHKALDTVELILEQQESEPIATVLSLDAYQSSRVEERATLVGTLETLSVHGAKPKFVIYDPLTNGRIDCFFPENLYEEVKDALPKSASCPYRVEVTGTAKFNRDGHPTSIVVQSFKKLRDRSELPSFRDLNDINLSGDLNPTEYIRRLRNA